MSTLSPTEICAKALVLLGQNPIADISDVNVPNAVKCNAAYPSERDALLSEYDWGFARKRAALAVTVTIPAFGYSYQFQLPSDCLVIRIVNDGLYAYEKEGDCILTDQDECNLVYTSRIEETGKFDSLFVDALVPRIARALAYSILKKMSAIQAMDAIYKEALPTAKRVDFSESLRTDTSADTTHSWLSVRG